MTATTAEELGELRDLCRRVRIHILRMIGEAGSGHPGGSLSAVEILVSLYFRVLRVKPGEPDWSDRDRFILSKGHAAPALYACLAERGYFDPAELLTLRRTGSRLQGHPDRTLTPGVEASTGSLGQGLSLAVGMALAGQLDGASWRVFTLLGDGESQEGQVWEAAMAAAHYRLENLTAFLDHNRLQIDGPVTEVLSPEPVAEKWEAFGWRVLAVDGHDPAAIIEACRSPAGGRPTMIVAETVKGKGVSYMEGRAEWHGKAPDAGQLAQALAELRA
ncbi:MAG: transketolase [bacterium]|nr:transketolase [bacterium]